VRNKVDFAVQRADLRLRQQAAPVSASLDSCWIMGARPSCGVQIKAREEITEQTVEEVLLGLVQIDRLRSVLAERTLALPKSIERFRPAPGERGFAPPQIS
jgi:hypothetical protein